MIGVVMAVAVALDLVVTGLAAYRIIPRYVGVICCVAIFVAFPLVALLVFGGPEVQRVLTTKKLIGITGFAIFGGLLSSLTAIPAAEYWADKYWRKGKWFHL